MTSDHQQSPRLGQRPAVASTGVQLCTLETLPDNAFRGQMVFRLDNAQFEVFDGVAWQEPTAGTGVRTFVGPTAPVPDGLGDLWMNNSTFQLSVWSGSAWTAVVDPAAQAAQTNASAALTNANLALGLVSGKTTIWYLPIQPASPDQTVSVGDYWVNTTINRLYRWDGSIWTEIVDQKIIDAFDKAGTAQSTADSKIITYTMAYADRPIDGGALGIGDLLFATDQGNKAYRWDGDEWIALPAAEITNMSVSGEFSLSPGSTGHISTGAAFKLDNQAKSPTTAPSYQHLYASTPITITDTFAAPSDQAAGGSVLEGNGICYDGAGNLWAVVNWVSKFGSVPSAKPMLLKFNSVTGAQTAKYDTSQAGSTSFTNLDVQVTTNYIWVLQFNGVGRYYLRRLIKATLVQDLSIDLGFAYFFAVGGDLSTNVHVAAVDTSSGNLFLRRYTEAGVLNATFTSSFGVQYQAPGLFYSASPPGITGARFIIQTSDDPNGRSKITPFVVSGSTLVAQPTEAWDIASPQSGGGFGFDGANFRHLEINSPTAIRAIGTKVFTYTNDTWTATASGTRWASAAFRAVNSTTGAEIYRTIEGPRVKITARKRAQLQLTAPIIPVDPTVVGEGGTNAVALYVGSGLTEPVRTGMWLQAPELTLGLRTMTFPATPALGPTGTNPLATGTFPNSTAGKFISAALRMDATPKVSIDGLGVTNLDGLIAPGTVLRWSTATAPAGWLFCDGSAISRVAYPDLAAAFWDGTNYLYGNGDLSTTFNLPYDTPVQPDTDWIAPSLLTGWTNFGATWDVLGYRRIGGVVYLKGLAKEATSGTSANIIQLPLGFRPVGDQLFAASVAADTSDGASTGTAHTHTIGNLATRLNVYANGFVKPEAVSNTGFVSLSGVSFPAQVVALTAQFRSIIKT